LKVALITGSYPPDVCGTSDYTARLGESLEQAGIQVSIFYRKHWSIARLSAMLSELDQMRADLVHMQYPTTGYGWKLGPQAIATLRPLVVTLHEASQSHPLRQLSLAPFLLRARHIIFTNQYEQTHIASLAPWIRSRSSVIPIGSNLPLVQVQAKRTETVTCFSIVRPQKGLEDVVEMARLLHQRGSSVRVRVIGALMPRWVDYFQKLKASSSGLPIDWDIGLDDRALSVALAETSIGYLPFPDGASERRSSLIAMLANKACVLTTHGAHTPDAMRSCVVEVASPAEAVTQALALMADPASAAQLGQRAGEYATQFSWNAISRAHLNVYNQLLPKVKIGNDHA
jgi:glycosyltransferase involved in cell wall biosynthesis